MPRKKVATRKKIASVKPKPKPIGWGIDQAKYDEARRKK